MLLKFSGFCGSKLLDVQLNTSLSFFFSIWNPGTEDVAQLVQGCPSMRHWAYSQHCVQRCGACVDPSTVYNGVVHVWIPALHTMVWCMFGSQDCVQRCGACVDPSA